MFKESDFQKQREDMIKTQLEGRGISNNNLLNAFRRVPRENFVLPEDAGAAYKDYPLSIGSQQTISQPYMVALMTELLEIKSSDMVLEIGTGSGYQTAILAELCGKVYTVERIETLSERAKTVLTSLNYNNISFHIGDGSIGLADNGPFNKIIVTCAASSAPRPLIEQLAEGGRMIIPIGAAVIQTLTLIEKREGHITEKEICGCVFVPLIGKYSENQY